MQPQNLAGKRRVGLLVLAALIGIAGTFYYYARHKTAQLKATIETSLERVAANLPKNIFLSWDKVDVNIWSREATISGIFLQLPHKDINLGKLTIRDYHEKDGVPTSYEAELSPPPTPLDAAGAPPSLLPAVAALNGRPLTGKLTVRYEYDPDRETATSLAEVDVDTLLNARFAMTFGHVRLSQLARAYHALDEGAAEPGSERIRTLVSAYAGTTLNNMRLDIDVRPSELEIAKLPARSLSVLSTVGYRTLKGHITANAAYDRNTETVTASALADADRIGAGKATAVLGHVPLDRLPNHVLDLVRALSGNGNRALFEALPNLSRAVDEDLADAAWNKIRIEINNKGLWQHFLYTFREDKDLIDYSDPKKMTLKAAEEIATSAGIRRLSPALVDAVTHDKTLVLQTVGHPIPVNSKSGLAERMEASAQ